MGRSAIWLCVLAGSTIGGFVPALWGGSALGLADDVRINPSGGALTAMSPSPVISSYSTEGIGISPDGLNVYGTIVNQRTEGQ